MRFTIAAILSDLNHIASPACSLFITRRAPRDNITA